MRATLILLLLALTGVSSAPADDFFDGVDLRPLVRMHSTRYGLNTFPPSRIEWGDIDTFVSRGGATNFNRWARFGEVPFTSILVRGVAKPAVLGPLRTALTANRVGTQKDCQIDTDNVLLGFIEITWYGQGTRRNAFRATLGDGNLSGLPACPQEVERIISAIDNYDNSVEVDPDSDVHRSN